MTKTVRTIRRATPVAVLASVATLLAASPATAAGPAFVRPQSAVTKAEECRDLAMINQERAAVALPPLKGLLRPLTSYARTHARDMATRRALFHDLPALQAAAPRGWYALGENVAAGMSIEQDHAMYMQSPGHRANILSASYK